MLNLETLKLSLTRALSVAASQCLRIMQAEVSHETIYAVSIFCADGCVSMGMAISTIESMDRKNANLNADESSALHNMLHAAEWQYYSQHYELFSEANELIDQFYEGLFDDGFEDVDINDASPDGLSKLAGDMFVEVIATVLQGLKTDINLQSGAYSDDVFLSLQFGDPEVSSVRKMLRVSEQVNSAAWHAKLKQVFSYAVA